MSEYSKADFKIVFMSLNLFIVRRYVISNSHPKLKAYTLLVRLCVRHAVFALPDSFKGNLCTSSFSFPVEVNFETVAIVS